MNEWFASCHSSAGIALQKAPLQLGWPGARNKMMEEKKMRNKIEKFLSFFFSAMWRPKINKNKYKKTEWTPLKQC